MPIGEQDRWRDTYERIRAEVGKLLVGYDETLELVLAGLFAGGHVLIEGAPGLGKTLLVRALGAVLGLHFSRIQFTPDLMPADITGTQILMEGAAGDRGFKFQRGPLFANLILADEINRATPKTQSALLEAMQEQAITVAGNRYPLPLPFFVLATQNPIEMEGTYPLPEAQIDRFLMKLTVGLPSQDAMEEVLRRTTGEREPELVRVTDAEEILGMQQLVRQVPVAPEIARYVATLVRATHPDPGEAARQAGTRSAEAHPGKPQPAGKPQPNVRQAQAPPPDRQEVGSAASDRRSRDAADRPQEIRPPGIGRYVRYGASPRAAQALVLVGKGRALMRGRFNVSVEDIETLACPVLRHRLIRNFEGEAEGVSPDRLIAELLELLPRPAPSTPLLAGTP